jgi:hypothetical protein
MRGLQSLAPVRAVGLLAVGVGLTLGATHLPAPLNLAQRAGAGVAEAKHADPVMQTRSICPGPESTGVEGLPDAAPQTVSVAAVAAPPESLPSGFVPAQANGLLALSGLPSGGAWESPVTVRGKVVSGRIATARSALVSGLGAIAPGTVATQWSWTAKGNSRGLVASACVAPAASAWLIGGGAAPGRLEHLVLANAGPNPVTVDISVLGAKGRVESPNGQDLIVPGRARTVILLDSIARSEPSPVVHVTARGGKVAAFLNDTWLDGLVPRGGDDAVPAAAPAREQVIAGVPIQGRAVLRIGVPGDSEAVVQTRVLTPGGPRSLPSGGVTRVAGGSTRDIALSSLPPGSYAVQVRGDVPVVAAVLVDRRRTARGPSDLAWSVASGPIGTMAGMALPATGVKGVTHRLDLVATGGPATVQVTTVAAGGVVGAKKVVIGADSVSTVTLKGVTSVWVTPKAGLVRAAVLTSVTDTEGALLSETPLLNLTLAATPLPLRQLRD